MRGWANKSGTSPDRFEYYSGAKRTIERRGRAVVYGLRIRQAIPEFKLPVRAEAVDFADFLKHRPLQDLAGSARAVKAETDPELNYIAAGHLSYAGHTYGGIEMLKLAIEGGHCSYPAIDSDPLLANVRAQPELAQIRSAAIACQNNFLAQRRRLRDRRPAAFCRSNLRNEAAVVIYTLWNDDIQASLQYD